MAVDRERAADVAADPGAAADLAADARHELGNVWALIIARALLLERKAVDPTVREDAEAIRGAAERGALLTRRLLDDATTAIPPRPAAGARRGSARVLVVEDDPTIRLIVAEALLQGGHEVDAVADADAALARIDGGAPYDVVVTDLYLPGVRGDELARHVHSRTPTARFVFHTGAAPQDGSFPDAVHLPKPSTPAAVVQAVAEALA